MNNLTNFNASSPSTGINIETANVGVQLVVGLTTVLSILLNVPVIIIMISGKCIGKTLTNIHILSLSFSDLLTCIALLPVYQSFTVRRITYDECWTRLCVFVFAVAVSVVHLCFICLERSWIILRRVPTSKREARVRFWLIILVSWSISALITVTPFVLYEKNDNFTHCAVFALFCNKARPLFMCWTILLLFAEVLVIGTCMLMIGFLHRSFHLRETYSKTSVDVSNTGVRRRIVAEAAEHQRTDNIQETQTTPPSKIRIHENLKSVAGTKKRISNILYGKSNNTKEEFSVRQRRKALTQAWIEHLQYRKQQAASTSSIREVSLSTTSGYRQRPELNKQPAMQTMSPDELSLNIKYLGNAPEPLRSLQLSRPRPPKHQVRAVITLALLAVVLFVTLTPMLIFVLFLEGTLDFTLSRQARHALVYFACLNSALNPIIYAFRIPEVRSSIRHWKESVTCAYCFRRNNN